MFHIVLVEDNSADAQMLEMAFQQTGAPLDVVLLENGVKAIEYLRSKEALGKRDLVMLDLNLPRLSGFEVLEMIRADDDLKAVPVVVFSGSSDPFDIERCYRAGANSYISKPTHLDDILRTVSQLVTYWSECVQLPSKRRLVPVPGTTTNV